MTNIIQFQTRSQTEAEDEFPAAAEILAQLGAAPSSKPLPELLEGFPYVLRFVLDTLAPAYEPGSSDQLSVAIRTLGFITLTIEQFNRRADSLH